MFMFARLKPFVAREAKQQSGSKEPQKPPFSVIKAQNKVVVDAKLGAPPRTVERPSDVTSQASVAASQKTSLNDFQFDEVFDEKASQAAVFDATLRRYVEHVTSGVNVTFFAYGVTGSGKSYNVHGLPGSDDRAGLLPQARAIFTTTMTLLLLSCSYNCHLMPCAQACAEIFSVVERRKYENTTFEVFFFAFEAIADKLRDLAKLGKDAGNAVNSPEFNFSGRSPLQLNKSSAGRPFGLVNREKFKVGAPNDVQALINECARKRAAVEPTLPPERKAPFAHTVWGLEVVATNRSTHAKTSTCLSFVELANCDKRNMVSSPASPPPHRLIITIALHARTPSCRRKATPTLSAR
jgi:hypothetical protein